MIRARVGLAALLCLALETWSGVVTDAAMGYSINLPANWVQVKTRENLHHFKDASGQYKSRIGIARYAVSSADYPTARDWTQAQFIAYKLAVETSAYPFGSVTYFDSSSAVKLAGDWAPEAFSILFPADGTPTYCEYLRYVARGPVGYEIYAIGDSTDMTSRIDLYAGIIQSLELTTPTSLGASPRRTGLRGREALPGLTVDAAGRIVPNRPAASGHRLRIPLFEP